jgi:Rieske Fe-S protein
MAASVAASISTPLPSSMGLPLSTAKPPQPSRRQTLQSIGALLLPGAATGCGGGPSAQPDPPSTCTAAPPPAAADWFEVPLDRYPQLLTPGAAVAVRIPEALLDVLLIHTLEGCFLATWRICPHGACTVDYQSAARELRCPCHGSRFAEDGRLLEGPALRALVSFPAAQRGDSVWIHRPL